MSSAEAGKPAETSPVEIFSIGKELLIGQIQDSNSFWLSQQITRLGGANFAPYFAPDDRHIIFASNYQNPRGRNFDLFLVNPDGTGLEQVTNDPEFDAFPIFSPDGKQLVWAANRHGTQPHETNIFIADWKP